MRLDGQRRDLVVYFSSTRHDGPAGTDRHIATRSAHTTRCSTSTRRCRS